MNDSHPASEGRGEEPIEDVDRVAASSVEADEARRDGADDEWDSDPGVEDDNLFIDRRHDLASSAAAQHSARRLSEDAPRAERWDGPPLGIRRADPRGHEWVDAMAGRSSLFGFGFDPVIEAIRGAAEQYLGDAAAWSDHPGVEDDFILRQLKQLVGESQAITADSIYVTASADMAVEVAIEMARKRRPNLAYRLITTVGSDHGRTGVCRIASGRPDLHDGYGPMMAGFSHVPPGDIDALRAAVDEHTCGVMLAPLDLGGGARPLDAEYLQAARETCDQCDGVLIVDESRIAFATAGKPLAYTALSDTIADAVILGGGLFGGLPGGIVIASRRLTGHAVIDTQRYPLLAAVAAATLEQLASHSLIESTEASAESFARDVAERIKGFEFVRDIHNLGMILGIEMDIASSEVVAAAARCGLRLETAGETSIQMQLPLVLGDDDRERLLDRLRQSMESIERTTANMSI